MGLAGLEFFRGKRVLVTGHTGFKGMWLCKAVEMAGAEVTGYALPPEGEDAALALERSGVLRGIRSILGDVRDLEGLRKAFRASRPEIVLHLAAQPIVLEGYRRPVDTYGTNVMGTVHVLECVREAGDVRSFLNVTTDKVYQNREWCWGYRETDPLDGMDPYANSKSCSELVTGSYRRSFFAEGPTAISTARAGNVIGGGDFAPHRIIPDCIRAAYGGRPIEVRNSASVRPYQHVLEPVAAYLLLAEAQYRDPACAGSYNVGPDEADCVTTGELAELFCSAWGDGMSWISAAADGPHEALCLRLDCSRLKAAFRWKPRWDIREAVRRTVEWAKAYGCGEDIAGCMERQIRAFYESMPNL